MHLALTEAAHVQPATQGCTLMLSELLHPLVVAKHEASLHVVRKDTLLFKAEHLLQQGEDALARCRVG